MAKFKGARAAHTTERGKKKGTLFATNRFSVLEVEEPHEREEVSEHKERYKHVKHFRLFDLPQELSDRILDEMVKLKDVSLVGSGYEKEATAEIRVDKDGVVRKNPHYLAFRGNRTLRLVSKRMRQEYRAEMKREMPLCATVHLTKRDTGRDGGVRFDDGPLKVLPNSFRRLCLRNRRRFASWCGLDGSITQRSLLADPNFMQLHRYICSCSLLTELVICWCLLGCWQTGKGQMGRLVDDGINITGMVGSDDEIRPALVQTVETLPNLQRYCIRTCYADVYASRKKGQEWSDTNVFRKTVTDHTPPSTEWSEFLKDMSGDEPDPPMAL